MEKGERRPDAALPPEGGVSPAVTVPTADGRAPTGRTTRRGLGGGVPLAGPTRTEGRGRVAGATTSKTGVVSPTRPTARRASPLAEGATWAPVPVSPGASAKTGRTGGAGPVSPRGVIGRVTTRAGPSPTAAGARLGVVWSGSLGRGRGVVGRGTATHGACGVGAGPLEKVVFRCCNTFWWKEKRQ